MDTGCGTKTSLPRNERENWIKSTVGESTRERLVSEDNPIRVFVTHTFEESNDYLRVFEFLESVDNFFYLNVSKPDNVPMNRSLGR